jgi:hypothetical protein
VKKMSDLARLGLFCLFFGVGVLAVLERNAILAFIYFYMSITMPYECIPIDKRQCFGKRGFGIALARVAKQSSEKIGVIVFICVVGVLIVINQESYEQFGFDAFYFAIAYAIVLIVALVVIIFYWARIKKLPWFAELGQVQMKAKDAVRKSYFEENRIPFGRAFISKNRPRLLEPFQDKLDDTLRISLISQPVWWKDAEILCTKMAATALCKAIEEAEFGTKRERLGKYAPPVLRDDFCVEYRGEIVGFANTEIIKESFNRVTELAINIGVEVRNLKAFDGIISGRLEVILLKILRADMKKLSRGEWPMEEYRRRAMKVESAGGETTKNGSGFGERMLG